jgi:hypothetical protein
VQIAKRFHEAICARQATDRETINADGNLAPYKRLLLLLAMQRGDTSREYRNELRERPVYVAGEICAAEEREKPLGPDTSAQLKMGRPLAALVTNLD